MHGFVHLLIPYSQFNSFPTPEHRAFNAGDRGPRVFLTSRVIEHLLCSRSDGGCTVGAFPGVVLVFLVSSAACTGSFEVWSDPSLFWQATSRQFPEM